MLSGLTDLNQLPAAQWCVSKVLLHGKIAD